MIEVRGARLIAAELALGAVTVAVAFGFGRLFDDSGGWFGPLVAIGVALHLTGAVCRRLGLGVALQILASGVVTWLVLGWFHAGDTLRYLLPTTETLTVIGTALDEAIALYPEARAPTEPIAGFVIAAMLGLAVVTTMADIAAFRIGAELQALVPPFTVFVFCSVLGTGDTRVLSAALFLVAAAAFVLVMRSLAADTGPAWLPNDTERGPLSLLQVGGGLTAVAALGAVLAGPLLPGADDEPLWTWRGGAGDSTRIVINPLVDIRSRIVNQSDEIAFTVESDRPSYWRMMALDEFDGQQFRLSTRFRAVGGPLRGSPAFGPTTTVEQRFELVALASPYLPAAFQPTRIDLGDEAVRFDDATSTLLLERDEAPRGLEYTVESQVADLDPEALRSAPEQVAPAIADRYLALPDLDPRVVELAESIVEGADTPYDRALALQNHLRTEFEYSVSVPPGHSDSELVRFLFDDRAGYCEQFSAAFAAMARVVGLPSRVAVGFTVGEPSAGQDNVYTVRGEHAHAWPEVWLEGIGWVAFEPTPGRGDPQAEPHTGVAADQEGGFGEATTTTTTTAVPGDAPAPTFDGNIPDIFGDLTQGDTAPVDGPADRGVPTPVVAAAAIAGTAGAWMLVVAAAVAANRSLRRRRAGSDPAAVTLASWAEAVEAARSLGITPRPTETHREFADRVAPSGGDAEDRAVRQAWSRLANRTATARFAPEFVDSAITDDAWDWLAVVVEDLRARRSRRQVVADLVDPRRAIPLRDRRPGRPIRVRLTAQTAD